MDWIITDATNFLRVFRLPDTFPSDYCFGGGHPTTFTLVDWFGAFSPQDFWDVKRKEYKKTDEEYLAHVEELKAYVKKKKYFQPEYTYMIMTDYGDVFLVNPGKRAYDLQLQYNAIRLKAIKDK